MKFVQETFFLLNGKRMIDLYCVDSSSYRSSRLLARRHLQELNGLILGFQLVSSSIYDIVGCRRSEWLDDRWSHLHLCFPPSSVKKFAEMN